MTALSFARDRVVVSRSVVLRPVDDATVLLDAATGRYFTLDDVGSRAWTLLTGSASIQEAYNTLLAEFDVEADVLRDDLQALVESLEREGLVTVERA